MDPGSGLDERHLRERGARRRQATAPPWRSRPDRRHGAQIRTMKVTDTAGFTDPGRKRRRNEDSYVIEPPLFAVADGMGGAQAGEVASRLAAAAFREFHAADELKPEERLATIIREANRRIYERASGDAQVSGMGATITAALVAADALVIG